MTPRIEHDGDTQNFDVYPDADTTKCSEPVSDSDRLLFVDFWQPRWCRPLVTRCHTSILCWLLVWTALDSQCLLVVTATSTYNFCYCQVPSDDLYRSFCHRACCARLLPVQFTYLVCFVCLAQVWKHSVLRRTVLIFYAVGCYLFFFLNSKHIRVPLLYCPITRAAFFLQSSAAIIFFVDAGLIFVRNSCRHMQRIVASCEVMYAVMTLCLSWASISHRDPFDW